MQDIKQFYGLQHSLKDFSDKTMAAGGTNGTVQTEFNFGLNKSCAQMSSFENDHVLYI